MRRRSKGESATPTRPECLLNMKIDADVRRREELQAEIADGIEQMDMEERSWSAEVARGLMEEVPERPVLDWIKKVILSINESRLQVYSHVMPIIYSEVARKFGRVVVMSEGETKSLGLDAARRFQDAEPEDPRVAVFAAD